MKLYLNLKKEYFMDVAFGNKEFEYRLMTDYWWKRLMNRHYEGIVIRCGYPKSNNTEKNIERPWLGVEIQTVVHPHFGNLQREVFAIRVNGDNNAANPQA